MLVNEMVKLSPFTGVRVLMCGDQSGNIKLKKKG